LGILSYHTVSIVIVINGSILNLMDIQNGWYHMICIKSFIDDSRARDDGNSIWQLVKIDGIN
jgi:hypothetical protein